MNHAPHNTGRFIVTSLCLSSILIPGPHYISPRVCLSLCAYVRVCSRVVTRPLGLSVSLSLCTVMLVLCRVCMYVSVCLRPSMFACVWSPDHEDTPPAGPFLSPYISPPLCLSTCPSLLRLTDSPLSLCLCTVWLVLCGWYCAVVYVFGYTDG